MKSPLWALKPRMWKKSCFELVLFWEDLRDEYARLVDGFKGTNRRQTTGEDQEDTEGRRNENKKPRNQKPIRVRIINKLLKWKLFWARWEILIGENLMGSRYRHSNVNSIFVGMTYCAFLFRCIYDGVFDGIYFLNLLMNK